MEAVRVGEGDAVPSPIRVCRLDGLEADTLTCFSHGLVAPEIEHHERLRVRWRRRVLASSREFEVSLRSRYSEEDAVVPVMVVEPPDLRQAESIPIEPDDLVESIRP
jgi:hypothetical protein